MSVGEQPYERIPSYDAGELVSERYEIVRFVGDGATSDVYEARDVRDGRIVALKIMNTTRLKDPVARERFHREAAVQAMIKHDNVAAIYGNGLTDADQPYLVIELFGGRCLRSVLTEETRVDVSRACSFVLEALGGLAACHAVGVRHRDLKPENMMLRPGDAGSEHVALIDFGFAAFEGESRLTSEGFVVGSMSYMAPERLLGKEGDARGDVYAIGVVLFELLTGRKPFEGDVAAVAHSHIDEPPPSPRGFAPEADISIPLEAVVLTALSKEPSDRYQSADAMAQALMRVVQPTGMPRRAVAASLAPEATVLCWDVDGVQKQYKLADESLQIGRAQECAIRSDDPLVSRYHARLSRGEDGQYWIEDLGSTNGVWVGAEQSKRAPVPPDEIVLVGSLVLHVCPTLGGAGNRAESAATDATEDTATPVALRQSMHARLWMWLRAERASRAALEDERNALGHRLGELHQALQQLTEDGADGETPHAVAQELQLLREEAKELGVSLGESESEKIELAAELSEIQRQLSTVLQKKMAESFSAQSDNARLTEQLDEHKIKLEDLEGRLHARIEEMSGLRQDLTQMSEVSTVGAGAETLALIAAQSARATLAERVTQLEDTLADTRRDAEDKDQELEDLRTDLADAAEPDPSTDVGQLNDQLAAFAQELQQLRQNQHRSHSTAARLKVQLDLALAEVGELRSRGTNAGEYSASNLSRVELEKAELGEKVAALQSEAQNLRVGASAADAELVLLRERLAGARAEAEAAWGEVDHLRKETGGN